MNYFSQFNENPTIQHWEALCRLVNYLQSTKDKILNLRVSNTRLEGFSDASWGTSEDGKSISGSLAILGGAIVSWKTIKQKTVSLSSMEAEYIALSEFAKEFIWITRICRECSCFDFHIDKPIIFCDNLAAIGFSKSNIENRKTKHINIRYHFIRECLESGSFGLSYVRTNRNISDYFIKPFPKSAKEEFLNFIYVD